MTPKIDIGGSWFSHDGIITLGSVVDSTFTNSAWGVDAQYGKPGDAGLFVLGEYLRGADPTAAEEFTIQGIQAIAVYDYRLKSPTSWLYAIEPLFRIDLADPNTDLDGDGATLIAAVLGFYMSSKAQFRVAYEQPELPGRRARASAACAAP